MRPGHPQLQHKDLQLHDLAGRPPILPPPGSVLRHRFDLMLRRAGLQPPVSVVGTTALLQQAESLHVMPLAVAQYCASLELMKIVPIDLPCQMDAFGIIRLQDHPLSPGAELLLTAVRGAAQELY